MDRFTKEASFGNAVFFAMRKYAISDADRVSKTKPTNSTTPRPGNTRWPTDEDYPPLGSLGNGFHAYFVDMQSVDQADRKTTRDRWLPTPMAHFGGHDFDRTTWHSLCLIATECPPSRVLESALLFIRYSDTYMSKILIVDDEVANLAAVSEWLRADGFEVVHAADGNEAIAQLYSGISVVVSDVKMPNMGGIELLRTMREKVPHVISIMMTGSNSVENAIEAMQLGAADYLLKPINLKELSLKIKRAIEQQQMSSQIAQLHAKLKEKDELYKMIGRSELMRNVFERIRLVADSEATVLITGESGTGKELVAKAVHAHSNRAKSVFLPVNFAAISESLIESELFGHEAGSFTGAHKRRDGVFHAANGGTLFLDEIGELQHGLQSKLLRVLENRTLLRVGGQKEESVDVRMVAATNVDLQEKVQTGEFREDLYYRLNVVNIELPPLRERGEDIPLLIRYFVDSISATNHRPIKDVSPEALDRLVSYRWPGNVRQLRNTLESVIVMSLKDRIELTDLPPHIATHNDKPSVAGKPANLRDQERATIAATLKKFDGKRKETSETLGISVRTLQRKIKEFDLEPSPNSAK